MRILDPVWKEGFLREITALSGFDDLAARSRGIGASRPSQACWDDIKRPAVDLIERYPRRILVEARQHCNIAHLVEFWRWYGDVLKKYILAGSLTENFPLFSIKEPSARRQYEIESLSPADFDHYEFRLIAKLPPTCQYRHNPSVKIKKLSKKKFIRVENLERFICKLCRLQDTYSRTTTYLYNMFIDAARQELSPAWGDYRIHLFLDRFLYQTKDGQICDAPFEKIFFSSNLSELSVYLRYKFDRKLIPSVQDVGKFLSRQRKYYLELAMQLDMAGAAYLNNYRHLLHYHPPKGIVILPEMESQILEIIDRDLIQAAGVIKMAGCPFAKSKGVSENAVLEAFRHVDTLMLEMVGHWYKSIR